MNYDKFENFIKRYVDYDKILPAPYIEGDSGIGKSEIIMQIAKEKGFHVVQVQIGTKTLEYFMGLPEIVKHAHVNDLGEETVVAETLWTAPEMVCLANKQKKAIIFIDDFHLARDEERKVMFELLTTHSVHGFTLNPMVKVIIAANPMDAEYGATVTDLPKPIRSRVGVFSLKPDIQRWLDVSVKRGIAPLILSFLDFRSDLFISSPSKNGQYCCPRSWWGLSRYLDAGYDLDLELVEGFIGTEGGSELLAFYNIYQKYEQNPPKSWKQLSTHREKAAFTAYMMIKSKLEIVKQFIVDMSNDPSANALCVLLLKDVSTKHKVTDKKCLEIFEMVGNKKIIEHLGLRA